MRAAILLAVAIPVGLIACARPPEVQGRALYQEFCVSCHGESGRGDGPAAPGLDRKVPDLTLISARNGGTYPLADVLSTIDGYSRAREDNLTMPEFGVMMEDGPLVMVDTGDGIPTPTPERLLALAEYLRTLQRSGG